MPVVLKPLSRDYLYPSLLPQTTPARQFLAEGLAQNCSALPAFKNTKDSFYPRLYPPGSSNHLLQNTLTLSKPPDSRQHSILSHQQHCNDLVIPLICF
ncbi:hypothetical protein TNCV_921341 [Trichonephila clavipes]|nr:hypothetical protein TNCV_921341 [Trichonephila clavipes]